MNEATPDRGNRPAVTAEEAVAVACYFSTGIFAVDSVLALSGNEATGILILALVAMSGVLYLYGFAETDTGLVEHPGTHVLLSSTALLAVIALRLLADVHPLVPLARDGRSTLVMTADQFLACLLLGEVLPFFAGSLMRRHSRRH